MCAIPTIRTVNKSTSACPNLAHQEKLKARVCLELVTNLKIVFELELLGKPKSLSLSLAWLDLIKDRKSVV